MYVLFFNCFKYSELSVLRRQKSCLILVNGNFAIDFRIEERFGVTFFYSGEREKAKLDVRGILPVLK